MQSVHQEKAERLRKDSTGAVSNLLACEGCSIGRSLPITVRVESVHGRIVKGTWERDGPFPEKPEVGDEFRLYR